MYSLFNASHSNMALIYLHTSRFLGSRVLECSFFWVPKYAIKYLWLFILPSIGNPCRYLITPVVVCISINENIGWTLYVFLLKCCARFDDYHSFWAGILTSYRIHPSHTCLNYQSYLWLLRSQLLNSPVRYISCAAGAHSLYKIPSSFTMNPYFS